MVEWFNFRNCLTSLDPLSGEGMRPSTSAVIFGTKMGDSTLTGLVGNARHAIKRTVSVYLNVRKDEHSLKKREIFLSDFQ